MRALGLADPWSFFKFIFLLIHNILENTRQGNADLYHEMWLVGQDWTKDLPFTKRTFDH